MSLNWAQRFSYSLLTILAVVTIGGGTYQYVHTKLDETAYPPPGKLVDVGGYQIHMHATGEKGPVVILDAGLRCNCLDWALVQPEIAKFARVLSYDRAGNGWSEQSLLPRTSHNMVLELHTLLQNAQIPGPYILVGHSFGGLNARLYASQYPDEVSGIILVDSPHEDLMYESPPKPSRSLYQEFLYHPAVLTVGSYLGATRLYHYFQRDQMLPKEFPHELRQPYLALVSSAKFIETVSQELDLFKESLREIKEARSNLGEKPLIVITASKCPRSIDTGYPQQWLSDVYLMHRILQKELVESSRYGKQIIAERSGHLILHDRPDIIIKAVSDMIELTNPNENKFICATE